MSQSDTAKAPLKYKLLLPVFFVVDVSGSIDNIGFSNINKIMRESIALLKERAQKFSDAEFEVAILVYSDDAHFITDGLVKLDCFVWKNISDGGILSELGKALKLLDSKLSKRAFMQRHDGRYCDPLLICISDGKPTDNWKEVLKEVKKNNAWFSNARIFCIAIGDDADLDVLGEISGSKEEKTFPSEKIKRLMDYIYPFEADWWFDILPNIEFEESYYSNTKKSVFPLSTDEIEKVYYDDEKDDFWN